MTINEAITKAMEAGYQVQGCEGVETYYSGANGAYSVWTRKDNQSSFMVRVEETFLDPAFWQALGRALGWNQAVRTVYDVAHRRPAIITRAGQQWLDYWHRFIDHLAAGKTAASFFDSLTGK